MVDPLQENIADTGSNSFTQSQEYSALAGSDMSQSRLGDMIRDAFHSSEELAHLPLELRSKTRETGEAVRTALTDSDMPRGEAWDMAAGYLKALNEARSEKEVYGGDESLDNVGRALQGSLNLAKVTPEEAPQYLDAMKALIQTQGVFLDVKTPLLHNHETMHEIGEPGFAEAYAKFITDPDVIMRLGDLYKGGNDELDGDKIDQAHFLIKDILESLDFQTTEDVIDAWRLKPASSLRRIGELERDRPGAARMLHDFYGVRNFGRFPLSIMEEQYDSHDEASGEYGIVLVATEDQSYAYEDLSKDIMNIRQIPEHHLRIVESNSLSDLDKRLQNLKEHFGTGKADYAYVAAHGTDQSIAWGRDEADDGKDIASTLGFAKDIFTDNPVFALGVCSTGKDGGVAQRISAEMDATVVGPDEDTGVLSLVARRGAEGEIKLEPKFANQTSFGGEVEPVEAVLYVAGKRIPRSDARYTEYFADSVTHS